MRTKDRTATCFSHPATPGTANDSEQAVWHTWHMRCYERSLDGSPQESFLRQITVVVFLLIAAQSAADSPNLTLKSGTVEPVVHPDQTVEASERHSARGVSVVSFRLPDTFIMERRSNSGDTRVSVAGKTHAVGAVRIEDRTVLVRLAGKAPRSLTVTVTALSHRADRVHPAQVATFLVGGCRTAPTNRKLVERWHDTLATWFEMRGRGPFYSFAGARLRHLEGKFRPAVPGRRERRSELGELMSLYTGMTSVEEALQADRGLMVRAEDAKARTIPVANVQAVPVATHPWEAMIKELGQSPQIEPLAAMVPDDVLYLHFHDLRSAVKLASDAEEWLAPMARLLEWRAGKEQLGRRYEEQLMLERSGLSRTLGHLAAKGVAVVVGDPFLRDGSDVAILFHIKNETLLLTSLARYELAARGRHHDLKKTSYTLGDITVENFRTPSRQVDQHRARLDDVLVVANSRVAIQRLVDVQTGKRRALKDSGDFRYFRAKYPFAKANEDGFVFISDAFVGRAVSPATRILQARRMSAQADLRTVDYATLLHGHLTGKRATSLTKLVKSGALAKAELAHADGTQITLDPAGGASSPTWGTARALVPLSELTLTTVSPAEKKAYDRFRETYQRYWRTFIDPIGLRIRRTDGGKTIAVDGTMMPLIQSSEYNELIQLVGDSRVRAPTLSDAGAFTFAVGEQSQLRRQLGGMAGWMGVGDARFGWLGSWISLGARPSATMWDAAILAHSIPQIITSGGRLRFDAQVAMDTLNRSPLFLMAHVRNPMALATTLAAVRAWFEGAMPNGVMHWGQGKAHRGVSSVTVRADLTEDEAAGSFTLHYAVCESVLVVALTWDTLTWSIDQILDDRGPKRDGKRQAHLQLALNNEHTWTRRAMLGVLETLARQQQRAAIRDVETMVTGLRLTDLSEIKPLSLAYLSHEPGSVHGGGFRLTDGVVKHSLYGSEVRPVVPEIPLKGEITRVIEQLKAISASISFDGKTPRDRSLNVRLLWSRR